jgi:glycosyltransferase involved in cell wall biosynthesis
MAVQANFGSVRSVRVTRDNLRFSVVVACFGHERFVEPAIRSAWGQTIGDFEIIAVDDGSPDRTGALLDRLAAESSVPMQVIHTPNGGADKAFNIGAALASGAYLAFLNDDDEYAPDRLDAFGRVIDKVGPSFSWGFSAVYSIDESGAPLRPESIPGSRGVAIELSRTPIEALKSFHLVNTAVSSGNLVVRADLFHDVGGFRSYRHINDWDLGLRLMMVAEPAILDRPLYRYRVHPANTFDETPARAEVLAMRASHRDAMASDDGHVTGRDPERDTVSDVLAVLDNEERFVVRIALWWLRALRSVRPAHAILRSAARSARGVRRRLRDR